MAAGQFFLLAGILIAWTGLRNRKTTLLFLAGLCWALAAGSRISLVPATGGLALLTVWQLRGAGRRSALNIAGLLAPLLTGGLAHAWYNFARFGAVTEVGLRYQLAATNQHSMPVSHFSAFKFVLPNLVSYLFQMPHAIKLFPYVIVLGELPIRKMFHLAHTYDSEYVTGLLWSQPFLLLAALAVPLPRRRTAAPRQEHETWLKLSLLAAALLGIGPALTINGGTMRYLLDTVPSLAVLSAFGFWTISRMLAARPRLLRELRTAAVFICLATIVMGVLMGTYGYYAHFPTFNPGLYQAIRSHLPALPW